MLYPKFTAICTAAKDCDGDMGGIIMGTKGFITTDKKPNVVGNAKLVLRDGRTEVFEENWTNKRMVPEFRQFIRAIEEKDYDFCEARLAASLEVNEVLGRARIQSGIRYK